MAQVKPLVLDVDGTYLKTDMLLECLWAGLGRNPAAVLSAIWAHRGNLALLKRELARIAPIRTDLLPVNPDMVNLARESISAGREVVLASASDESLVQKLSAEQGLGPRVFASDGETNLKGECKAAALVAAYGEAGFDYAGNAQVDRAVWDHSENALIVGHLPSLARELSAKGRSVSEYPARYKMTELLRALRPHQWVKNVLLILPLIAAHRFDLATLIPILWGMVAFSAAASSIYVVNDLLDLEADRLHPTKCRRPFAAGTVPIGLGMATGLGLGLFALVLSALIGWGFLAVIALYMALSLAYSLKLKRMRWVDVATLAGLYTIRVVAGAAAGQVVVSVYMLIFIFPIFITLGCVKRLTELTLAKSDERLPGRGYGRSDRGDLLNVAGLGVVGALLIFLLYSFSDQGRELYPTQWILWVAMIPMAFWLIRMVVLGYNGRQDYDPIVFAMRDKMGIGILMITLSLMFWAAGLWAEWFS